MADKAVVALKQHLAHFPGAPENEAKLRESGRIGFSKVHPERILSVEGLTVKSPPINMAVKLPTHMVVKAPTSMAGTTVIQPERPLVSSNSSVEIQPVPRTGSTNTSERLSMASNNFPVRIPSMLPRPSDATGLPVRLPVSRPTKSLLTPPLGISSFSAVPNILRTSGSLLTPPLAMPSFVTTISEGKVTANSPLEDAIIITPSGTLPARSDNSIDALFKMRRPPPPPTASSLSLTGVSGVNAGRQARQPSDAPS